MTGSRYAPGTEAWGLCKRCHLRFLLNELVFDGWMPGLRVCVDCFDDRQPQEFLVDVTDPEALWKPSPEDGPHPPILTGTTGAANTLDWTEATPRGGPRFESYTLMREASTDGGITYTPPVQVFEGAVVYDDFAGILSEPLSFVDTAVTVGVTYRYTVTAFDAADRGTASNAVVLVTVPVGFSITAGFGSLGGQTSEGYGARSFPDGPTGSLNPGDATLAGFPVAAFFVNSNNSGDEGFYIALTGAPLNAVWHIRFTDSNNVLWDILSTNMQHFQQGSFAVWDIQLRGADPYPLLLEGITYPITVVP